QADAQQKSQRAGNSWCAMISNINHRSKYIHYSRIARHIYSRPPPKPGWHRFNTSNPCENRCGNTWGQTAEIWGQTGESWGQTGAERVVSIVGTDEIDLNRNHISWVSPLGRALMKSAAGDSVLGMASVISGPAKPSRHISMRMAFSDDRAK